MLDAPGNWLTPDVSDLLNRYRGPFLLGGTAPDVRNISTISRERTHFYHIPPDPSQPSVQTMLAAWPLLADPAALQPDHAAFIAGYLAHLWFDEFWYMHVILPYFLEQDEWGGQRFRFDTYNILIGYLDNKEKNRLDGKIGDQLQNTTPHHWMPFIPDADLDTWKKLISNQLLPGAPTKTIEILARRAHMEPADYARLILNEAQMDQNIFNHIPRMVIEQVLEAGRPGSARTIMQYLDNADKPSGLRD